MAHGNLSDLVFVVLLIIVGQFFGCPHTLFQDTGLGVGSVMVMEIGSTPWIFLKKSLVKLSR